MNTDVAVNEAPPDSDLQKIGSESAQKVGKGDRDDVTVARENSRRYMYVRSRGHVEYCAQARRNDDFYLGGGLQWDQAVKEYMESQGRPASECNEIQRAVNTVVGYQIANRMDVQFVPADSKANPDTAKVLSKVIKQIFEKERYKWKETQVFTDGLIVQRGYFDIRTTINDTAQAEIEIDTLDAMDVLPDPDGKDYEPETWLDVIVTRWLTSAEIGERYGSNAEATVVSRAKPREGDFGDGTYDDGIWRNRFGDPRTTANEFTIDLTDGTDIRYRVIDRQHHIHEWANVAVYPTGEIVSIENVSVDELTALKANPTILLTKRRIKRVRWTVSACEDVLLHDDWSPYSKFTIVPFYPIFRRGRTRGMVDNAISPQETLNKAISQAITIVNTSSNSGWIADQNSLTNMTTEELENIGGKSGLTMEVKEGARRPEKIQANPIPAGITNLIQVGRDNIKSATGVDQAMMATGQEDMSGVAIQSRQYAAQQNQAMPLDNLSRTRHMVAQIVLEFIQKFMPDERVVRITNQGAFGVQQDQVTVNQVQPDGSVLHDLTLGTYDVIVTDQPMQVTFDNTNFTQIQALAKDFGFKVPPSVALRYSNLPDKAEIAPLLEQANTPTPDPVDQAKADLLVSQKGQADAKTEDIKADTVEKKVTAVYSATQAAAQAAVHAGIATVADAILETSGFEGANPIPVDAGVGLDSAVPGLNPGAVPQKTTMLPTSTDPMTPAHPDVGVDAGIRGGQTSQPR